MDKRDKKEAILNSARALFIENGYQSTSVRDIARKADVNLALVNYYFSSKEDLFDLIFDNIVLQILNGMKFEISAENSACENIEHAVNTYTEALIKNPELTSFIFQEIIKHSELLNSRIATLQHTNNFIKVFINSLNRDIEKGIIRKIDNPEIIILNIVSLCVFPFISKPLVKKVMNIDDKIFVKEMRDRKKIISDMLKTYLTTF